MGAIMGHMTNFLQVLVLLVQQANALAIGFAGLVVCVVN
jgi:hypothetical protein